MRAIPLRRIACNGGAHQLPTTHISRVTLAVVAVFHGHEKSLPKSKRVSNRHHREGEARVGGWG